MFLDIRTDYSLLSSLIKIDDIVKLAKEKQWSYLGIADESAGSLLEFYLECKANGVKPILGLRFRVTNSLEHTTDSKIILYAQNLRGYHNLLKLSSKACIDGFKDDDSNLTIDWLEGELGRDLLCVLPISESPNELCNDIGADIISKLQKIFKGRLFFGLYNRDTATDDIFLRKAEAKGTPYLFLSNAKYTKTDERLAFKVLRAISEKNTVERLFETIWLDESIETSEKRYQNYKHTDYMAKFVSMIDLDIPTPGLKVPKFPVPQGFKTSYDYLVHLCREGYRAKIEEFDTKEKVEACKKRMAIECDVIRRCELSDYFLLVYDICKYCDESRIPRGISRGCLTPDSSVRVLDGYKKICDVDTNDLVISSDGCYNRVLNTFQYMVSEDMVEIKHRFSNFFDKPLFTKDHKILAVKNTNISNSPKHRNFKYPTYTKTLDLGRKPEYIAAKDIERGDFLCVPITEESSLDIDRFDLVEYIGDNAKCTYDDNFIYVKTAIKTTSDICIRYNSRLLGVDRLTLKRVIKGVIKQSSYSNIINERCEELGFLSLAEWDSAINLGKNILTKVHRFIECDADFLKILGMYISDGWGHSRGGRSIGFGFHSDNNKDQIKFVNDFFSKRGFNFCNLQHKKRRLVQIQVNSFLMYNFFESLVDKYAANKNIHPLIKQLPIKKLESLVTGLMLGDGHIKKRVMDKSCYDSINLSLVCDLREILIKMGIPSSVACREPDISKMRPSWSYKLQIAGNDLFGVRKFYGYYRDEDYIYIPVMSVKTKGYKGPVYDLEVENNPSFRTSSYVVHNSAGGCLIAFLTDISRTNPLTYNLLFERFLNEDRTRPLLFNGETYLTSAPDIDLDVGQLQRQQVIEFLRTKYGFVAKIATYTTLSSKACIKDTIKAFGRAQWEADRASHMIEVRFGKSDSLSKTYEKNPDFKQWADNNRKIYDCALYLEDVKRNVSLHAAGILVSGEDIGNSAPMFLANSTGDEFKQDTCIAYSLDLAEKAGLLKVDILGIRTLCSLSDAIDLINK